MAELATLARPYAEALFQVTEQRDSKQAGEQLSALARVVMNPALRQFADAPSATSAQVFDVVTSVAGVPLTEPIRNLLHTVIDNGRLSVLTEIAAQFQSLVEARSGTAEAIVYSAFPMEASELNDVLGALETRFKRKLILTVRVEPELIGGIRVVVGDEVLDTSVKARLEQMKAALTA